MTDRDDEFDATDDDLAERLAGVDEELAEQRAAHCAPGSRTTSSTRRTSAARAPRRARRASATCPRCPSSRSSAGRTSASPPW